jgi:hypothetical protein
VRDAGLRTERRIIGGGQRGKRAFRGFSRAWSHVNGFHNFLRDRSYRHGFDEFVQDRNYRGDRNYRDGGNHFGYFFWDHSGAFHRVRAGAHDFRGFHRSRCSSDDFWSFRRDRRRTSDFGRFHGG